MFSNCQFSFFPNGKTCTQISVSKAPIKQPVLTGCYSLHPHTGRLRRGGAGTWANGVRAVEGTSLTLITDGGGGGGGGGVCVGRGARRCVSRAHTVSERGDQREICGALRFHVASSEKILIAAGIRTRCDCRYTRLCVCVCVCVWCVSVCVYVKLQSRVISCQRRVRWSIFKKKITA